MLQLIVRLLQSACCPDAEDNEDDECQHDDADNGHQQPEAGTLLLHIQFEELALLLHLQVVDMEQGVHLGKLALGVGTVERVLQEIHVAIEL